MSDPRPRLVLFAFHFPPSREVGALRAAKVAQVFAASGVDVHVITVPHGGLEPGVRELAPGLHVHTVKPWRSPRELVRAIRRPAAAPAGSAPAAEHAPPSVQQAAQSHASVLKRLIFALLWLPDDVQGFIPPAQALARALCHEGTPVLYSTAPPFSPHVAALATSWRTGAPLVLEFRDPWADNPQKPAHVRTWVTDRFDAALELLCLRRAKLAIAVSEGIHRLLRRKLGERAHIVTIRNGIDRLQPAEPLPATPFIIVHAGTCSYDRDPRPFFQALASATRDIAAGPTSVEVHFLGDCDTFHGESLRTYVEELGISSFVRFRGWVPREDALELIRRSHLLLLLAQSQPDQVPNKLYEYLGVQRPILAFADQGGEVAALLMDLPGHCLVTDNSAASAVPYLREALRRGTSTTPMSDSRLLPLTAQAQMQQLVREVAKAVGWPSLTGSAHV